MAGVPGASEGTSTCLLETSRGTLSHIRSANIKSLSIICRRGYPFDQPFGCPDWRQGIELADRKERGLSLSVYRGQLKANWAKQVLRFELYEAQQLIYVFSLGPRI